MGLGMDLDLVSDELRRIGPLCRRAIDIRLGCNGHDAAGSCRIGLGRVRAARRFGRRITTHRNGTAGRNGPYDSPMRAPPIRGAPEIKLSGDTCGEAAMKGTHL